VTPRAAWLLLVLLVACGGDDAAQAPEPAPGAPPFTDATLPEQPPGSPAAAGALPARPEQVTDTIRVEGMPEALRLVLLRSPDGFRPPFSTYVPADMRATVESTGDSAAVRVAAQFGGIAEPNAYIHIRSYPPGQTLTQVQQNVRGFLRSREPWGDEAGPTDRPQWAQEAYAFSYSGDRGVRYVGRAIIAHRNGRFFHVLTHYPAEFGDGFGPRAQAVLRHWRWEDDGTTLEQAHTR
jgi:hypothetical protein